MREVVPLEELSQKIRAASAYLAICWLRIGPAASLCRVQLAGNREIGRLSSLAAFSPRVSAPDAVPETTSVTPQASTMVAKWFRSK